MSFVKDLNTPLLQLSAHDVFRARDAVTGVHIFGQIGSGKTSGSGAALAGAYLRAGMGGLVAAVKPAEVLLFQHYAKLHNRQNSLFLFDENEQFNFLSYELEHHGFAGIGSVVECLMRITETAKRASATASQRPGEAFWEEYTRAILRYAIPPLYAAHGSLSIADISRFVSSAPGSRKEVHDAEWQKTSFMYEVLEKALRRPKVPMPREAMEAILAWWSREYSDVPARTKGNLVAELTSVLDRFRHGRLARIFTGKTTWVPELSLFGCVTLMGMPTLTYGDDGLIAQQILKYFWQKAVLNRNSLADKYRERFVFLWCDEAQELVHSYDGQFLGLCRDSKCCVTYLTQSLPAYYSKIGTDNPQHAAANLVGKFGSHIYHAQACPDTNDYASRMLGKALKRRNNYSQGSSQNHNYGMSEGSSHNSGYSSNHGTSHSDKGGSSGNHGGGHNSGSGSNWGTNQGGGSSECVNSGYSENMEFLVEPGDFARTLKTGGWQNGNQVTGVWFQSGRIFEATGTNMLIGTFNQ